MELNRFFASDVPIPEEIELELSVLRTIGPYRTVV